jgi:PAS domain-containing protein
MFTKVFEADFDSCLAAPEASFLHTLWVMSRGVRDMPLESDLPSKRLDYLRDDLMILRPLEGRDWFYEHYGKSIALNAGFDMTGRKVSDFQGVMGEFYTQVYERVCRERRPLATWHRLGAFDERPLWERIILPVGTARTVTGLYVVNKVREMEKDISHLTARARGRGLIVLQFRRNAQHEIVEATIVGANALARTITGRRLDEMIGQSMLKLFPGLVEAGLWSLYLKVAETQHPEIRDVDYDKDGVAGSFRVQITPFIDGVTVDFELQQTGKAEGVTASYPASAA